MKSYISNKLLVVFVCISLVSCSHTKSLIDTPDQPPIPEPLKNINIALVLGGGGSKGIAHVGVLKILEENNIPIDLIVGCSAGSAIGALYADYLNADIVKNIVLPVNKWDVLDPSIGDSLRMFVDLKGPIQGYYYENFLIKNLISKNIETLKIPLVVVTTDLFANQLYLLRSGPIAPAVHASSAIPPFFSPVRLYGKLLVDGGVKSPVPVNVAKLYKPKIIIAVDIGAPPPEEPLQNMWDVTYRSIWIFYYELSKKQRVEADIIISPDLRGHGTFEDGKKEELYYAGIQAAEEKIPLIREKMKKFKIPFKRKEK
jgi:NTE family protein